MRNFTRLLILLLILLCGASCVHQSFDLEECIRGVRIEPVWVNTQPVDEQELINVSVTCRTPGIPDLFLECGPYGTDVDLAPAVYDLIGWENADNIAVRERIVTVASATRAVALEPGVFSGGTGFGEQVVTGPGLQVINVPMYQQTRELIIRINFTGDVTYLIDNVEASVTGVTLSRDIDNAFFTENEQLRMPAITSGEIQYSFVSEPNPNREIWYRGARRLIGIDGDASQMLQINVSGVDGSFNPVEIDITGAMNSFQVDENVAEPMVITFYLTLGIDLELSIVDWELGGESPVIVS